MEFGKKYITGVFDDDGIMLNSIAKIRSAGVKIEEVYTPFPVHHLEDALGYKRSRLPMIAFMFSVAGTTLALVMQISMIVVDWPMIIGGKPFFSYPDFVPVAFELSVLLAAYGMVITFFVRSDLKPYKKPKTFDLRSTDDCHIMAVDLAANSLSEDEIRVILKENGAVEVNNKEFED